MRFASGVNPPKWPDLATVTINAENHWFRGRPRQNTIRIPCHVRSMQCKRLAGHKPRHSCRINGDDTARGGQQLERIWQLPARLAVMLNHRVIKWAFHGSMIPHPLPAGVCYDAIFQVAMADLDETLKERGSRYGKFVDHAAVTQDMKAAIKAHAMVVGTRFTPDQQEALDMICHKIGRIVSGDPNYADSWHDIAGYAKLVEDRLNGNSR